MFPELFLHVPASFPLINFIHKKQFPGTPMPKGLAHIRSVAFTSFEVRLCVGVTHGRLERFEHSNE